MIKLSIIVPIYGVEQYLRKCVDSMLAQDIVNYEIILVDDGSPDNCPQICDEYAAAHKNVRVVHRKNGGLSAARNSGIEVSRGEYIMFVDSDDNIEQNVLKGLLAQIERDKLDVLRYNFRNVNEKNEEFHPNKDPKRDVDYSESVTDGVEFLNNRLGPMCYAWAFVIKRELLEGCIFTPGIYFEDTDWTPRMLLKAKRVASTPMIVYNYLWREGSITLPDNPQKREKVLRDKVSLLRGFKEQSKLVGDSTWFISMTSFITMTILEMLVVMPSQERESYIRELKSMQVFPLAYKQEKMLSHKIKTIMANISPSLYCRIMQIRHK